MVNSEDLRWARQGKETWNAWAQSDESSSVDFSSAQIQDNMKFDGFIFPHKSDFSNSKLKYGASFNGCTFLGPANFDNLSAPDFCFSEAIFKDTASFKKARTNGKFDITESTFENKASFENANVSSATFEATQFKSETQFANFSSENGINFKNTIFYERSNLTSIDFRDKSSF